MRVLYIVTAYSRHAGDVITPWLTETIHRLGARGVHVEVLAPAYRGLGDQVVDGVRVHRFRYAPSRVEDLTHDQTAPDRVREHPAYLAAVPGYVAAGSFAAARLARRGDFDLVHVHWPIPHAIMGFAARRAAGIPLISTFHGVELTWVTRQMPFLRPLLRSMIRRSNAVTANSTYTAGLIRQVYDRPVERIPFGAAAGVDGAPAPDAPGDSSVTPPIDDATAAPAPDPVPFRLLFVGRLVERKGVTHLIDALARVQSARPMYLSVIGEGPLRAALERQAADRGLADRLTFHGFVPGAELTAAFQSADAFVLPAVTDRKGDVEGLGVVLIEALTHGTPVIASRAGGITDIVRHDETGLLVPAGDPNALAHALERLAADATLCAELARRGREHVEREFGWDRIIDRLVHLYERVVS